MTDQTYPDTADGWGVFLQTVNMAWRRATSARQDAERALDAAQAELDAAYAEYRHWQNHPARIREAWAPILARATRELGIDFEVTDNGGGTQRITGDWGPVRVHISDYGDGDLSHPEAGKGWWVGFYGPDAPWGGEELSIIGDPDARDADEFVKLVAFAVAGFLRGERHHIASRPGNYEDGIARIEYGDE